MAYDRPTDAQVEAWRVLRADNDLETAVGALLSG